MWSNQAVQESDIGKSQFRFMLRSIFRILLVCPHGNEKNFVLIFSMPFVQMFILIIVYITKKGPFSEDFILQLCKTGMICFSCAKFFSIDIGVEKLYTQFSYCVDILNTV